MIVTARRGLLAQQLTRSCFNRLGDIQTGYQTLFILVVTTRCRSVFKQQPRLVLHSAGRNSGGSVRSVSLIAAVTRSRIGISKLNSCFNRLSEIREDQLDPSHPSLQSTEAELVRPNRFRKIGFRDTFGTNRAHSDSINIREDQSVLSL